VEIRSRSEEGQSTVSSSSTGKAVCDRQDDLVTLLRQQLATKTEECQELRSKLENIEADNARIMRNQENFLKVSFFNFFLQADSFPMAHPDSYSNKM